MPGARKKRSTARQPRPWLTPPRTTVAGDAVRSVKLIGSKREADIANAITSASLRATRQGAAQLTISLADPDRVLIDSAGLLDEDEDLLLDSAIDVRVGGIWWRLMGLSPSDRGCDLLFQDREASRLMRRRRHIKAFRGKVTRVGFVARMYAETHTRLYAPELLDVQDIVKPKRPTEPKVPKAAQESKGTYTAASWPASTRPKVKGQLSTPVQLRNIVGILDECRKQGASRRVMIAAIMCATQESVMGAQGQTTGNDDTGLFQQGRNWISLENVKDPGFATRAFLLGGAAAKVGGTGAPGWKQIHGSLRTVPGGYESAIKKVQVSVGGYSRWEDEATKTVDAWLDNGGGAGAAKGEATTTAKAKAYVFERGQDGKRENTIECANRLADEVDGLNHWVFGNTGVFASDEELIGAPVGLIVHRDDDAVVSGPSWKQDVRHSAQQASVEVLVDRLPEPGQVAVLEDEGPATGKWMIDTVECDLAQPVDTADGKLALRARITFARSTKLAKEPAHEVTTTETHPDDPGSAKQSGDVRRVGNKVTGGSARERLVFAAKEAARLDKADIRKSFYSQLGSWTANRAITGEKRGQRSDCSQWVIAIYKSAGLKDPSGNNFAGGFTGTLYMHADRVASPLPGDLCMYGAPPGVHVELFVGDGKTIGHGDEYVNYSTPNGPSGFYGYYRPRVLKSDD